MRAWADSARGEADYLLSRRIQLAATAKPTQLEQLRAPFPVDKVKQRPGGGKTLDYIAIETVLERLLDVAPNYSWDGRLESFVDSVAIVSGTLTINGKTAFGIGAMKGPDADMSVKSANSEAMKNAAKNGFGVMLELWDEEYRNNLAKRRKLTTPAAMKQEVYKLAREKTGKDKPTPADIAKTFGVNITDLGEVETLRGILEAEGLL